MTALEEKVSGEGAISTLEQKPPAASDLARQEMADEDEENETCGFCIFMKAGGCKTEFQDWSKCVDGERKQDKDFTEECREKTASLTNCMLSNKDYYAPVLDDKELFEETKDKFDASTTNQNPQEAASSSDDASASNNEAEGEADAQEEADEPEEAEEEPAHDIKLGSAPYDQRFPSYNQARHCYTRYNEYHRCIGVEEKSESDPECTVYQKAYRAICPMEWVHSWNEQREAGTWPGKY